MKALGRHILGEFFGCNSTMLNDVDTVERVLVDAALKLARKFVRWHFTDLAPQGG